jgi:hypothetical protein
MTKLLGTDGVVDACAEAVLLRRSQLLAEILQDGSPGCIEVPFAQEVIRAWLNRSCDCTSSCHEPLEIVQVRAGIKAAVMELSNQSWCCQHSCWQTRCASQKPRVSGFTLRAAARCMEHT